MAGQEVTCAKEGMKFLESTLLTVLGVPYTAREQVGTLFQISMLPSIKNIVRATSMQSGWSHSFILEDLDMVCKANKIAEVVSSKLEMQMNASQVDTLS